MTSTRKGSEMLTDEQRWVVAEFVADFEGGDADDFLDGIDGTRDRLELYDGRAWHAFSVPQDETLASGHAARMIEAVQVNPGDQRLTVFVVDFGDVRGVYQV